jgi:hypothetical protein
MPVFPLADLATRKIKAYSSKKPFSAEISISQNLLIRERGRRRQVVSLVLLVIIVFQLVDLPGAIMMQSAEAIGTVVLGLALCAVAMLFNRLGKVTLVSILLIIVVDLGCGLMLLMSPMGLDVNSLPVFDVLIVSELIAVSLLPPSSVFVVAVSNIIFILADIILQPATMDLKMVLHSNMGYSAVVQPISMQIIVAVISYIWVRSALNAIARADQAEEIAELERREVERKRELDQGIEYLSQVLVRASNGDRDIRVNLSQDNMLWRVGNSFNMLLTRLRRSTIVETENQRLRAEVNRLDEALRVARRMSWH